MILNRLQRGSPWILSFLCLTVLLSSCNESDKRLQEALRKSENQEGIEFENYYRRQKLVEDSNTILWCTFSLENPNSPLVTIPVKGKLTSSSKRPHPINSEYPGADGMYGSSGQYRYGFGPGGIAQYYELDGLHTFCTTQPLVWHREKTTILMEVDEALDEATSNSEAALRSNNSEEARRILEKAINEEK